MRAESRVLDSARCYYLETFVIVKALSAIAIDGQTDRGSDHFVARRRWRTRPRLRTELKAFVHAEVNSSMFYGVLCLDLGLTKVFVQSIREILSLLILSMKIENLY